MKCNECNGEGYIWIDEIMPIGMEYDIGSRQVICSKCGGKGWIN